MIISQSLPRREAARLLQSFGLRTTSASLATMATRGGGPPFFKIGKLCMYQLSDLEMWIAQRCTGLLDSTSASPGKPLDDLFEREPDIGDLPFDTGQPGFDEVTRLLSEEAAIQKHLNSVGDKFDQQFI